MAFEWLGISGQYSVIGVWAGFMDVERSNFELHAPRLGQAYMGLNLLALAPRHINFFPHFLDDDVSFSLSVWSILIILH